MYRDADGSAEPHFGHHRPHKGQFVNEAVSQLAPYSALILTIVLVIFFLIRYYLFENFLLPRCYGDKYSNLKEVQRRGFVNHHIAGVAKVVMAVFALYPFLDVTFGKANLHSRYLGSKIVTMGDVLLVLNELFISMYIFELFYRAKLSPVAVCHHIGAIVIAQNAVAMSMMRKEEHDATIEFILCFVWGAFDVIAEFWPHVAIILYRVYPTNHQFLTKVFRLACISTFAGTVIETIVVMWLFGSSWSLWSTSFKLVTPFLHVVFSAAQLWGAWNFRSMWLDQERLLKEEREQKEQS